MKRHLVLFLVIGTFVFNFANVNVAAKPCDDPPPPTGGEDPPPPGTVLNTLLRLLLALSINENQRTYYTVNNTKVMC